MLFNFRWHLLPDQSSINPLILFQANVGANIDENDQGLNHQLHLHTLQPILLPRIKGVLGSANSTMLTLTLNP